MTTLTRQEIHWIIGNLDKDIYQATEEKESLSGSGGGFGSLLQLRIDNMTTLTGKLQAALDSGAKRIAIR